MYFTELDLHFNGVCQGCHWSPLAILLQLKPPLNYTECYASQRVGGALALQLASKEIGSDEGRGAFMVPIQLLFYAKKIGHVYFIFFIF